MPYQDKPAFRCKNCGHLESAEHAGENETPAACSVCGAGITFSVRGIKNLMPENWEVLHLAETERLKQLGLHHETVTRHVPLPKGLIGGTSLERFATEGVGASDKA